MLLTCDRAADTRQGKAMRATAQDHDAARLMGINVDRTIAFTFALGGAMAGAAAIIYLQTIGTTRYDAGFQLGLIAFTAAVLGGIGNLNGAVLGGLLIGLIQGLNDGAPHGLGQRWSQTVVFTILILLMVFRPDGHSRARPRREGVTWPPRPLPQPADRRRRRSSDRSRLRWPLGFTRRSVADRSSSTTSSLPGTGCRACRPSSDDWLPLTPSTRP